jgi:ribosomal protein L11 methyltransferase
MASSLYQITLSVSREYAPAFAECLEPHLDSVAWTAREGVLTVEVVGFSKQIPNEEAISMTMQYTAEAMGAQTPRVRLSKIHERNWVLDNIKQFPPLRIGRFFVHGNEFNQPIPYAQIALCIPAAAAFGSGDHGSTNGCLVALDKMDSKIRSRPINSALDMGCGSGILAIAIAKRWHIPVIATDIDPISTKVCSENARANGVANFVKSLCASGYKHRVIMGRKFDVIVSNILAQPLTRLAKDLGCHLNPGGWAILSGLLISDTNRVISAHASQGLRLSNRITVGDWQTLIFKKTS